MTSNITKKIVKISIASLALVILLIGGTIFFLATTIDQETIKNKAVQLVHEKTGRDLKINGNINWTYFPWLGIKIENITLSNPSNFKDDDFAKAAELSVNIKLLPLIWGNVEIGNVTLKNLQLQLIKNSSGISNWQDLVAANQAPPPHLTDTNKSPKPGREKLSIGSIAIDNGSVSWQDQKLNKNIKISGFNFHCENISPNRPFTIATSFFLDDLTSALSGKISTQIKLDLTKDYYEFRHLQLSGNLKHKSIERIFDFNGKTEVILDLGKQSVAVNGLKLNIADTDIAGSFQGLNIKNQPKFSGDLNASSSNASGLIQLLGLNKFFKKETSSSFKVALTLSPNVTKFKTIEIRLNDITLQGSAEYAANNLAFNLALNNQGKIHGNANINTRSTSSNINIALSLENAPAQVLLTNLANFKKFTGTLTASTNINVNSLTGDGHVAISHGSYYGVDIPYEVRRAHALLNAKPMPKKSEPPHTDFDRLTMTFKMNNGTLNTNDLLIQAQDYKVTGQGNINLNTKNIDFSLSAYSTHDENFFVPVKITGSLDDPSVRFDAAVMLQHAVKKVLKDVVQKQIEKHLPENLQQQINKIVPLDKLFR